MFLNSVKKYKTVIIYDEGPFKIATSITDKKTIIKPCEYLSILYNHLPKPDVIIILDTNPVNIYKRRRVRNRQGFDDINYQEMLGRYEEEKDYNHILAEKYYSDIKIIKLKKSFKDASKNLEKILSMIKAFLNIDNIILDLHQ